MKYLVVSDIHGSLSGAEILKESFKYHQADAILCLGDILYHGPRNDLPSDYAPKKVIEIMTRGLSGAEAYYMGNIIKYLYRYPKKGTLYSDLAKAEEYTKFLRELFMEDGGKA